MSGGCLEIDDLGARVTGDVSPLWNERGSSGLIRSAGDERSNLCGNGGRWSEDREMVDALRSEDGAFASCWADASSVALVCNGEPVGGNVICVGGGETATGTAAATLSLSCARDKSR